MQAFAFSSAKLCIAGCKSLHCGVQSVGVEHKKIRKNNETLYILPIFAFGLRQLFPGHIRIRKKRYAYLVS